MIRSLQPPDRVQLVFAREIVEEETNEWYLHDVGQYIKFVCRMCSSHGFDAAYEM